MLSHNGFCVVPSKYQDNVRLALVQGLGSIDWDVLARTECILLANVVIHKKADESFQIPFVE